MLTLTIPQRKDPIARLTLLACAALVVYAAFVSMTAPQQASAQAEQGPIIIVATPALPTPALAELPGVALAVATPTPELAPTAAPGWLDQTLAAAGDAGDQFATDQAAALAREQEAAALAAEQAAWLAAEQAKYLANVAAQAPHSPRGDVPHPPAYSTGETLYPASGGQSAVIIDPNMPAAAPQIAVAVPHISAEQAVIQAARQSNTCAAGQVFVPRTGCYTPGSSGPLPGAVGEP